MSVRYRRYELGEQARQDMEYAMVDVQRQVTEYGRHAAAAHTITVLDTLQRRVEGWAIDARADPTAVEALQDVAEHIRDLIRALGGVERERTRTQ